MVKLLLLFVGGLGALMLGLLHPVGPALLVLVAAPFDPVMTAIFGRPGNYFSLIVPLLVLLRTPPGALPGLFLGTKIQQVTLIFFLSLLYGHLAVYPRVGVLAINGYLAKLNVFLMIGVVAMLMADRRYIDLGIKLLVASMAAWSVFCVAEFYLGIEVFPTIHGGTDVITSGEAYITADRYRLVGVGESVPPNRLGMYFIPSLMLAIGWMNSPRATARGKIIGFACAVLIGMGLLGTISRASYGGALLGIGIALVLAGRVRFSSLVVVGLMGLVLVVLINYAADVFDFSRAITERISGDELTTGSSNRLGKWTHGLRLFAESPITGVGWGVGETAKVQIIGATDPHNAFIQTLAFHGIIGFMPLMVTAMVVARVLMMKPHGMPDHLIYWRPYMVAGIVGTLFVCMYASFLYDRYLWFMVAFAVAWERAVAQKIYEHTQAFRRWESGSPPEDAQEPAQADGRPAWHPAGVGPRS